MVNFRTIPLAIAVLLVSTSAHELAASSTIENRIAYCSALSGNLDRLECFDQLSADFKLDAPRPAPVSLEGAGKWQVIDDTNPIDDSRRVVLYLQADEGASKFGEPINLIARCMSNRTDVVIQWNDFLGDDDLDVYSSWKYVTIRVGDSPAERQRWNISTDNSATFAPTWAGNLLKEMVNSESFLAQTTPFNENPVTAIFDTRGLRTALTPLMEACKWKL